MDASDLARWTRFAAKGGIGKCTALRDCVAERTEDLMFLKDDEITVLLQLPEENQFLGHCEDVVGRFSGSDVQFHGKLKKPVFAKRQSGTGSPSHRASATPRSSAAGSQSPSAASARGMTSPSPLGFSLVVPSLPDSRPSTSNAQSPRSSVVAPPLPTASRTPNSYQTHRRIPSAASSTSHYSIRSTISQERIQSPVPPALAPAPPSLAGNIRTHARNLSTASSRSAYSSTSRPSSRAPSRTESLNGSGSEETYSQHISLPPPLPISQASQPTPTLTDGSSAHSSFVLSPGPVPAFPQSLGKAPASLFQARNRNTSDKFASKFGSSDSITSLKRENDLVGSNGARSSQPNGDRLAQSADSMNDLKYREGLESSFASTSLYSDGSDDDGDGPGEDVTEVLGSVSYQQRKESITTTPVERPILIEEDSDSGEQRALAASPDEMSDAGFGIGMNLLRDDDDSDDDESHYGDENAEDSTAVGHGPSYQKAEPPLGRQQTLAMRIMNPDTRISPSVGTDNEREIEEDVTAVQTPQANEFRSADTRPSLGVTVPRPSFDAPPPHSERSPTSQSQTSSRSQRSGHEDHWSDADIYDDYRYSRYSRYSSMYGSPSSKRRPSHASEVPPMPLDRVRGDTDSETGRSKSPSSQHSVRNAPERESVMTASTAVNRENTPSPVQTTVVPTTSANPPMEKVTSPLTKAFRNRNSDESRYSRDSAEVEPKQSLIIPQRLVLSDGNGAQTTPRARSPTFASALRERIENEHGRISPNPDARASPALVVSTTSHVEDEENVVILDTPSPITPDEPSPNESPLTPSGEQYLRVESQLMSAPPSPLNPSFPPSPSPTSMSFATTAPLNITKSPPSPVAIPSPANPRHSIIPPGIAFLAGKTPGGQAPAHMQFAQSAPPQRQMPFQPPPVNDSSFSALRMAGQQRASTIRGYTQMDILNANGPVPISFLLPGMPPPLPSSFPQAPSGQVPFQPNSPINGSFPQSSLPGRRSLASPAQPSPASPGALAMNGVPVANNRGTLGMRSNSMQVPPPLSIAPTIDRGDALPPPPASPLPRANFFPQVGQPRPRSRSFSDFNSSEITDKVSKTLGKPRSQEEGSKPLNEIAALTPQPNSPAHSLRSQSPANQSLGNPRGKTRPAPGPSPLSLPPTTNSVEVRSAPSSPLIPDPPAAPRPGPSPLRPSDEAESQQRRGTLQPPSSRSSAPSSAQSSSIPKPPISPSSSVFAPQRRTSTHSTRSGRVTAEDDNQSLRPPSPLKPPPTRHSTESDRTFSSFGRSEMTSPPPGFAQSSPSSSPMTRSGSLRSKISMSGLRPKVSSKSTQPRERDQSEPPLSPSGDEDRVQIKDMEFELVRPVIQQVSDHGDDSDAKDSASIKTDFRSEASHNGPRSPTLNGQGQLPFDVTSRKGRGVDPNQSIQAHRERESKWISLINSTDSAQAKKNKKIKKLLVEGVPASVRYLVWAHISHSSSKKMPNVYLQLSKRRPPMAEDIERDAQMLFPDAPQLRDPNGPLVAVLFAFITMVPDIRYTRGLAIIAGHLLLQSPEEDAFWIFLAMMDSYLRPYFSPISTQMSVDTNLFVKTIEASDSQLVTRVFAELNVRANDLCAVWFSSVFAGTLPLEHLHRVWDLFLYEGIPFLFRVGLTILSCCRRYFLEGPLNPNIPPTAYLLRPPPEVFPANPEDFIAQVLAVRLKDDDIRKSRIKMEAAATKQQQGLRKTMSIQAPSHPHLQQAGRARVPT